ncbi:type II toxin-antitoxin system RelE/ParE family toxin [Luteibacter sp. NPDC031894]|jgi:plasmid stabilization system protein ParE|uniref:type II toxin-antitoxin system RelE/ParE family toxin n=1 Tax=Luteibacter sp. NPDC031894 TaxID=3390572 RepID=UPI003CFC3FF3
MKYEVRYTDGARADLLRLTDFLAESDADAAERALATLVRAVRILDEFPYTCRRAGERNPFLRELVVPFGNNGYVVLFHIGSEHVTLLAIRHQREDDYFA